MTMARQRAALQRFRSGEVNVLFATSIAEEGLDIQRCGLVIRTEPPRSIISNIQVHTHLLSYCRYVTYRYYMRLASYVTVIRRAEVVHGSWMRCTP
jgi:endoribonuclease Dicer